MLPVFQGSWVFTRDKTEIHIKYKTFAIPCSWKTIIIMKGLVFNSTIHLNLKSRKILKELSLDPDYLNYMKTKHAFKNFVVMERQHAAGLGQYFSRLQMQESSWQDHDVKMKPQQVLLNK